MYIHIYINIWRESVWLWLKPLRFPRAPHTLTTLRAYTHAHDTLDTHTRRRPTHVVDSLHRGPTPLCLYRSGCVTNHLHAAALELQQIPYSLLSRRPVPTSIPTHICVRGLEGYGSGQTACEGQSVCLDCESKWSRRLRSNSSTRFRTPYRRVEGLGFRV